MHAEQREAGNIMIKGNLFRPALFIMAILTLLALFTLVHIIGAMTGQAVMLEFGEYILAMTGRARGLGMAPTQHENGVFVVIESHRIPFFFIMAVCTFFTVAAAMKIVGLMA